MSVEVFGPEPEGATPLTDDDYTDLKPKWVATREDLNQAEAQNILAASDKYFRSPLDSELILDDYFIRQLHKEMYSEVWGWAGKYRKVETSIGVDPLRISESVHALMENAKIWINTAGSATLIDQAVCEVHHKLVQIHPFRNGNGRMPRMFANLLLVALGWPVFTWGGGGVLETTSPARSAYIGALRKADTGDLALLYEFVRTDSAV